MSCSSPAASAALSQSRRSVAPVSFIVRPYRSRCVQAVVDILAHVGRRRGVRVLRRLVEALLDGLLVDRRGLLPDREEEVVGVLGQRWAGHAGVLLDALDG